MSDGKEVKRLWVLFKIGKDESAHQITDVSMNPLQGAIEVCQSPTTTGLWLS
ncbi:MAG: hypothetical protein IPK80_02100 [Nannocystis sp.]|nr:hypothetical protein [Nannocystis sp.]